MIKLKGLYIHIPFCIRKCAYCGFYSVDSFDKQTLENFTDTVVAELKDRISYLRSPYTLYIGGGTPTVLPIKFLERIVNTVFALLGEPYEFTIEANPGTVTPSLLKRLKKLGVNRLSLGIQSFRDDLLRVLGRAHTSSEAYKSLDWAQNIFENVNVDLMFGIPTQTLKDLEWDLKTIFMFAPPHISYYGLSVEENTLLGSLVSSGIVSLIDDDLWAKMYDMVRLTLTGKGYQHYEISNYAKAGFACIHNMIYWRRREYIGLGPSAVSFIRGRREKNVESVKGYISAYKKTGKFKRDIELIDFKRECIESLMLSLRTSRGIHESNLKRWGCESIRKRIKDLVNLGFLETRDNWIKIKEEFWSISNRILAELL